MSNFIEKQKLQVIYLRLQPVSYVVICFWKLNFLFVEQACLTSQISSTYRSTISAYGIKSSGAQNSNNYHLYSKKAQSKDLVIDYRGRTNTCVFLC